MSVKGARATMKRSRRRPKRRRRSRLPRILTVMLLTAALIAAGVYYVGKYIEHMTYLQYPLEYEELIIANAEEFGLEPWHVAAVVRCESSFRTDATSNVGARGLMQIMPDTGRWLAGKFDEEAVYTDDRLYEAETNLKYGCWFLSWLMRRYEGDRTLATAAYHAGHGTVDEWLKDPSVSADGRTLRRIPFSSTETYLSRVMTACEKYQELYSFGASDEGA